VQLNSYLLPYIQHDFPLLIDWLQTHKVIRVKFILIRSAVGAKVTLKVAVITAGDLVALLF
jgi:hypothetical protein